MNQARTLKLWDYLGMSLSLLCLIHCLALPLLIGFLPLLASSLFEHDAFHPIMLAVILPVAGLALLPGYLRTRNANVLLLGIGGISLLALGILAGHEAATGRVETALSVLGGCLLFRAHWLNHLRACPCPEHEH